MKEETSTSTLRQRVEVILKEKINPVLGEHGGQAVLHSIEGKDIKVSFKGACQGCPSMQITMEEVVEKIIKNELPEEVDHVYIHNEVSKDLLDFAKELMNRKNQ
jgi:Fe-S cluster biogenesis protein NfuA